MDFTIKNITLFLGVLLTGLSSGLFYAWSVSVIPGTKKVLDPTYLETMQLINKEILNPAFFLVFFGSMIALGLSAFLQYGNGAVFYLVLGAFVIYALGTFGVTGFGNVPLNNQLDALDLNSLSLSNLTEFRQYYEAKWNAFHQIRTACSVVSFLLAVFAVFLSNENI